MFNSLEELKAAVEDRRQSILTLEVDMGGVYSQDYEDAKQALAQAKAMKTVIGSGFLADNLAELEQRVADTRPAPNLVWVQYRKIGLDEWAKLTQQANGGPVEQYEKVLPKVFVGVFGQDPLDEEGNRREDVQPLSTDGALLSSKGPQGILPGGALTSVVSSFMAWQNSGGDVSIRPTKSGQD